MKLKCDKHDRRVLTVPGNSRFLHRTGDMSECDSKTATIKDPRRRELSKTFILLHDGDIASQSDANHPVNEAGRKRQDAYADSLL